MIISRFPTFRVVTTNGSINGIYLGIYEVSEDIRNEDIRLICHQLDTVFRVVSKHIFEPKL